MKKISAYEIALSALACALSAILLTVGSYVEILLFTGYLFGSIALTLPLVKKSYVGYALAYVGTCVIAFIFNPAGIFNLLPFVMFFGLHPLVNELQLKSKINRWLACAIKALWFDITMFVIWKFVFGGVTAIPFVDKYILPILLVFGSAFFGFYDYTMYKGRAIVWSLTQRFGRK